MRKRLFGLVLVLILLLSCVPFAAAHAADPQLYSFDDMADLRELCAKTYQTETYALHLTNDEFVLTNDLTIPENLFLEFLRLTIPEGVTLTVPEDVSLVVGVLQVDGVLKNDGYVTQHLLGVKRGLTETDTRIGETGRILNSGHLTCGPNADQQRIENSGTIRRWQAIAWLSDDDFTRVAELVENNPDTSFNLVAENREISLTDDLTIPDRLSLDFTGSQLTVPRSCLLKVDGSIHLRDSRVNVEGTLDNGNCLTVYDNISCYEILPGGEYRGDGLIILESTATLFPLRGVEQSLFEEKPGGYYTRKREPAATPTPEPSPTPTPEPDVVPLLDPNPEIVPLPDTNPEDADRPAQGNRLQASTGTYRVVLCDDLGLLSSAEAEQLVRDMVPITAYGNVAFWTTDEYARDEVEQARLKRRDLFGMESGLILVINMNVRKVSIQSYGTINKTISADRANTITNNVRNYLTRGSYYEGASVAFGQVYRVLEGSRIPQPMKYLSNAAIALMLSLMLMLPFVFRYSSTYRRGDPILIAAATALSFAGAAISLTGRDKRKISYSDGGSSGGSSCSSCGSSCSSCGSGGSSSF